MVIQVLASQDMSGHDPLLHKMDGWARGRVELIDHTVPRWTDEVDLVVVWNALDWYLRNRYKFKGRPGVVVCSWCYDDLYSLNASSLQQKDAGIDFVITNCRTYVEQSSTVAPAYFSYKPHTTPSPLPYTRPNDTVGTVIPNVKDRDFSQVEYAYNNCKDKSKFRVYYCRTIKKESLPRGNYLQALEPYEQWLEDETYQRLAYYIPAPRLSDYRMGVCPVEILKAIACNCTPVLVYHPALKDLNEKVSMIGGVSILKDLLNQIPTDAVKMHVPHELMPTWPEFSDKLLDLWKQYAAARR